MRRSTEWLRLVLSGAIDITEAPAAVQSWATYFIYEGAVEVLRAEGGKEGRAAMLAKIPDKVRPLVEAEAKRVWALWKAEAS